jgi:hypothetical protein
MTYQPPPPPPPPAGNYGGQPSRPAFDPKSVNPLDWGILAAGVLAFIFSFVSYYSYSVSAKGFGSLGAGHWDAWHGFFGWFAMLCALVGSAVVAIALFMPQVRMPLPARLAGLGAYALGTVCVILALFIVPGDTSGASALGVHVNKGHSVGYWISLIVIIAGLVMSLMRLQQEGGQLPGALNNLPNLGAYGPGQHGTPAQSGGVPPAAGYVPPPAQGYSAPPPAPQAPPPAQTPPPGYQPPGAPPQ